MRPSATAGRQCDQGNPGGHACGRPQYGRSPQRSALNTLRSEHLRLHDLKHRTNCRRRRRFPARGATTPPRSIWPCRTERAGAEANGREQTLHQSFSRVMHGFHGRLGFSRRCPGQREKSGDPRLDPGQHLLPMPSRKVTQCFRGEMFNAGRRVRIVTAT